MWQANETVNDTKVEQVLGHLLRAGVVLSAGVVLVGGIMYLIQYWMLPADRRVFHGEPGELRRPEGILEFALAGHSRGMIQLGLLLLIATPVARVAFSVYAFWRERDRLYVLFTSIVLALLLGSLFIGHP